MLFPILPWSHGETPVKQPQVVSERGARELGPVDSSDVQRKAIGRENLINADTFNTADLRVIFALLRTQDTLLLCVHVPQKRNLRPRHCVSYALCGRKTGSEDSADGCLVYKPVSWHLSRASASSPSRSQAQTRNMLFKAALFASVVASVSAHATFQEMWINGVDQGNYCVRLPASNSPVTSVTTPDLACNVNPSSSGNLCSVSPGDSVTVEMHQQPNDRSCANEAIGGDHYGPINIYMAKVDDATTAVGADASWFKINEMGMPSDAPDYWATEVLNDNCGHFTFTIPSGIATGQYLLRAEVIALHVASSVGGAQFYMSCFQLNVGGTGTTNPPTVKIPGAYGGRALPLTIQGPY
ncbi:hypothetical protein EVG20_g9428 [Dentipellis fragilis]|uniref:AA9 family lytic polysaccharide monooxygenase n=1 Tax=Dentipellis fragilis TaxID=205917 RepID=A0A4Y9Y2U6_9AGAM|nr:hypothetical protein EVG20_g9428 [Dentipellis fragilis]